MDIFAYAESINYNADYMDMSSGNIYKIQDYARSMRMKNCLDLFKDEKNRKVLYEDLKQQYPEIANEIEEFREANAKSIQALHELELVAEDHKYGIQVYDYEGKFIGYAQPVL